MQQKDIKRRAYAASLTLLGGKESSARQVGRVPPAPSPQPLRGERLHSGNSRYPLEIPDEEPRADPVPHRKGRKRVREPGGHPAERREAADDEGHRWAEPRSKDAPRLGPDYNAWGRGQTRGREDHIQGEWGLDGGGIGTLAVPRPREALQEWELPWEARAGRERESWGRQAGHRNSRRGYNQDGERPQRGERWSPHRSAMMSEGELQEGRGNAQVEHGWGRETGRLQRREVGMPLHATESCGDDEEIQQLMQRGSTGRGHRASADAHRCQLPFVLSKYLWQASG